MHFLLLPALDLGAQLISFLQVAAYLGLIKPLYKIQSQYNKILSYIKYNPLYKIQILLLIGRRDL